MKINNDPKNDLLIRLERFASKFNETARQMVASDPQILAEQVRRKGLELLGLIKSNLFFKERARASRPEYMKSRVKKKVIENLEDEFLYPEVVEAVTDSLIQAARMDSHYKRSLGLDSL